MQAPLAPAEMHAGAVAVQVCPPPPALSVVLANNIKPLPYNRENFIDPDTACLPPTYKMVEQAAKRLDPMDTGMFAADLERWGAFLDAREEYHLRVRDERAAIAAAEAAEALEMELEAERLERDKKFLSTYTSPMDRIRDKMVIGEKSSPSMHDWQARAAGKLMANMSKGYKDISAKLIAEPHVCSGKPECPVARGFPGAQCTCTNEDKLINHFHQEKARIARVWVTQGGGKTLVECLLPLLLRYDDEMLTCPEELKTRDITIITAPENQLLLQMRGEGLGVTNRAELATMPMYTKTGIDLDVLIEYNSRVHFLPKSETADDVDWPSLRERYSVIVGSIQKWGYVMKAQKDKPVGERLEPEDIRTLIGDESHLGTGWKATPWEKYDKDASWGWAIQRCWKSNVFKFSGSLKSAEEDLPIVVECKACELIDKGLLCAPQVHTWGFEGMVQASTRLPFEAGKLDEEDARELRLGAVGLRLAALDIAKDQLKDRDGVGEYATGMPITAMTRVACNQAYDGATPAPRFVADHINAAYSALPKCKTTNRKPRAAALVSGMSADQEQDAINKARWGFEIDNLVVEDKLTLGYSDVSKKQAWNLRKVGEDNESQEAHKQFFGRGSRPMIAPPADLPEYMSPIKMDLRVAALGHVGCDQCKNYGRYLTNKAWKALYKKCVAPEGSPEGLCALCKPRVDARAQRYFDRLAIIGATETTPDGGTKVREQLYHIHELQINSMKGSHVDASIDAWARDNECEHYMRNVTRELIEGLREEERRTIQNLAPVAQHHQAQLRQSEAEAELARVNARAEAARLEVEAAFKEQRRAQARLLAEAEEAAERAEREEAQEQDSMSDEEEEEEGGDEADTASQRGSDAGDEAMLDDSDSESLANELHAMGDDDESEAEDAEDAEFDPNAEHEGEAGASPGQRRPSRRAAAAAQRAIELEAARQARIEEAERAREARALEEQEAAAVEVHAAARVAAEAEQEAIDAQARAVDATDEAEQQRLAERRRELEEEEARARAAAEERRQALAQRREEQARQAAEDEARREAAERAAREAAAAANERMRAVLDCVPTLDLLQAEGGAVSVEFTMRVVPLPGTVLLLAATTHGNDLGSSGGAPTNFTRTKWKPVSQLGLPVSSADGEDAVVRSMPQHLLQSRNAQTGERGAFCILALPPGHERAAPEAITFGDLTYKTRRFDIDLDELKRGVVAREAAAEAAAAAAEAAAAAPEGVELVGMEVEEEAAAAVVLVPNTPEPEAEAEAEPAPEDAAAAAALVVAGQDPHQLSVRQEAQSRMWEHVTANERAADADEGRGVAETKKVNALKHYFFGIEQEVKYRDALLAPAVLDIAKADDDRRRRDFNHGRHFSRALASKHLLGDFYQPILESYIAFERSGTAQAQAFKNALDDVRYYSDRYHPDPKRAWKPPAVNARTLRAAPAPDAPVFKTAEDVLRMHPAGWALIEQAFARLEQHQQQTGGYGNIQLPPAQKLPRKRERLMVQDTTHGLIFKKQTVEAIPRLQHVPNVDDEEDQEGDWDHSLLHAKKGLGESIVSAILRCPVLRGPPDGKPYERNSFNTFADRAKQANEVKEIFHIDDAALNGWGLFPLKSLHPFPDQERDIKGRFGPALARADPSMSRSRVKNFRQAMHWACRGHAIVKDLATPGQRTRAGVNMYGLRDAIRERRNALRGNELRAAIAADDAGGCTADGSDEANWMAFIRHKYPQRVAALAGFEAQQQQQLQQ